MTKRVASKEASMPIEVDILTSDHEIRGIIHVARDTDESRRISELLNDGERRFLAITDARLIPRQANATPRLCRFLQISVDSILLLHPSAEATAKKVGYSAQNAEKLDKVRGKLRQN